MTHLIRIVLLLLAVCAVVGISSSCSEDTDCSLEGRRVINCMFYTIDPDDKSKALKDTLDSLTITALGTDSIILNNMKDVKTVSLPLRFTSDTTVFVFHYDYVRNPKNNDTLYVVHSNVPYFQSVECGYLMQQDMRKASISKNNEFDSLYIVKNEAQSNEATENIKLFFHYRD